MQSTCRLGYGIMSIETTPLSSTPRTTLRRHRERGQTDRAALYQVLDAGLICHLGVVSSDGTPVVLPTAYGRDGDTLYLHGSSANGALRAADGQQVCVTVTHLDGLVAARSVFSHSVNYRSAVIFGTATIVKDEDERADGLRLITDHLRGAGTVQDLHGDGAFGVDGLGIVHGVAGQREQVQPIVFERPLHVQPGQQQQVVHQQAHPTCFAFDPRQQHGDVAGGALAI